MKLTTEMHDAVRDSEVGQFLSRLIKENYERGGDYQLRNTSGNVIQMLWAAFMEGAGLPLEIEYEENPFLEGIKERSA